MSTLEIGRLLVWVAGGRLGPEFCLTFPSICPPTSQPYSFPLQVSTQTDKHFRKTSKEYYLQKYDYKQIGMTIDRYLKKWYFSSALRLFNRQKEFSVFTLR